MRDDLVPGAWTDPWEPTEKEFAALFETIARAKQWRWYHTFDSRRSAPGFPDYTLINVAQKRLMFVELKGWGGATTTHQRDWLRDLSDAGAEAYLVTTTGDKAHDMAALAEMFDPPYRHWPPRG